jgi:hypothetical protein
VLRVASRKSLYIIKKLYGSSFSRIGIAVYRIVQLVRLVRKKSVPYIMILRCEYDNLIKLREICDEIVDPGPFCCTPAMLAL